MSSTTRDPRRLIDDPQLHALMASAAVDEDDALLGRVGASLAVAGVIAQASTASASAASATAIAKAGTAIATSGATSTGVAGAVGIAAGWKVAIAIVALGSIAGLGSIAVVNTRETSRVSTAAPETTEVHVSSTHEAARELVPYAPELAAPPPPEPERRGARSHREARERARAPERARSAGARASNARGEIALVAAMRASIDEEPERTLALVAEHRARFGESGRFVDDVNGYEALAQDALGLVP